MEISPYFISITDARSMKGDFEEQLAGNSMLSIETQEDGKDDQDIYIYVCEAFDSFMHHLQMLEDRDRDMLLSYYMLGKTQEQLALIFGSTQTVCSFTLRQAMAAMAAMISYGGQPPTPEQMRPILESANLEQREFALKTVNRKWVETFNMSQLIWEYAQARNYQVVADKYHMHRPYLRRSISQVRKALMVSELPNAKALGSYIHVITDKMNPAGTGISARQRKKYTDIRIKDPDCYGQFRVNAEDPGFEYLFSSRASR